MIHSAARSPSEALLRRRLALLAGLHLAVLLGWSVLVPAYVAPDEPFHVDLMREAADGDVVFVHGERSVDPQVAATVAQAGLNGPPRGQRPAYDEAVGSVTRRPAANYLTQHPPLGAVLGGAGLRVAEALPGRLPWDVELAVLRTLSALLVASISASTALAAAGLLGARAAVPAGLLPLAVPQLSQLGAAASNDALLLALCAAAVVPLLAVVRGDLRIRTAVAIGLLVGAALLTKAFALALLPAVAGAYAVAGLAGRAAPGGRAAALRGGAVAIGLAGAVGGWWWLRNVLVAGRLLPLGQSYAPAPDGFVASLRDWLTGYLYALVQTSWGALGALDVLLPVPIVVAAVLAGLGLAVLGLLRPPGSTARRGLLVVLVPAVGLVVLMARRSWSDYVDTAQHIGMQGRYLFAGLPGVVLAATSGLVAWLGRRAALAAVLAVIAAQATAAVVQWRAFWPHGSALLAASPWPEAVTVALLAAGPAALLAAAVRLVRSGSPRRAADEQPASPLGRLPTT